MDAKHPGILVLDFGEVGWRSTNLAEVGRERWVAGIRRLVEVSKGESRG